jgi:uncharacterized repeat protein (TIGR03803 family)
MLQNQSRISSVSMLAVAYVLLAANVTFASDTYKVLHWFDWTNGANSSSGLTFDASGNLYGTTYAGGTLGGGTVFQLVPDGNGGWTENVLYNFCSAPNCPDGGNPSGGLIFDSAGSLYGTTVFGGQTGDGEGVVFQLNPGPNGTWTEKVLYRFCSITNCADGISPVGGLVFDKDGDLYGVTVWGGGMNDGTVFELVAGGNGSWTQNVLYSFCSVSGCADGQFPRGSLIFDSSGNLYGTTQYGGVHTNDKCSVGSSPSCGTVFELIHERNGAWTEQVLYSFNYHNGAVPNAGLIFDGSGNLYGTTFLGGPLGNGVVFELTRGSGGSWADTVIHPFYSPEANPTSTLVFDHAGNLYGTTTGGGAHGDGIVFKLSPGQNGSWTQTVAHSFTGKGGSGPTVGVVSDSAGNLYGTTGYGGMNGAGVAFEIIP